jgi:hypothetical protein
VSLEFIDVWKTQHELFMKLLSTLSPFKPLDAQTEKEWIRANAHPRHFNFRGFFMRSVRHLLGDFNTRWIIYYKQPELLYCFTSDMERIDEYNLEEHHYFDQPKEQQDKELTRFIKKSLARF